MMSSFNSLYPRLASHFRPYQAEALYRVRVNSTCLIAGVLVSYIIPSIPSLHKAIYVVRGTSGSEIGTGEWFYQWLCILEVAAFSLFFVNILHGLYAVRYPRVPPPHPASPTKPKIIQKSPATPSRPFKVLSPQSSPQPQKPFSFSPSSSFGLSMTTNYPTSPVSTPSRIVHYPAPPNSSTNTQASTSSSINLLSTPSPVISAYRGKHTSNSVGRALDGSFLGRLASEKLDGEDE